MGSSTGWRVATFPLTPTLVYLFVSKFGCNFCWYDFLWYEVYPSLTAFSAWVCWPEKPSVGWKTS